MNNKEHRIRACFVGYIPTGHQCWKIYHAPTCPDLEGTKQAVLPDGKDDTDREFIYYPLDWLLRAVDKEEA